MYIKSDTVYNTIRKEAYTIYFIIITFAKNVNRLDTQQVVSSIKDSIQQAQRYFIIYFINSNFL